MATSTVEERNKAIYEIAEAVAPTWVQRSEQIEQVAAPVREWMVRALAPGEGDVVLELAAGVGETGFDAAEAVGERGKLISTDLSPTMVAGARRRAEERGIGNVEHRVMSAERIDLPDESVDGVLCRFGYMLMADPARALAETRRVLRRGRRLAFAVWAGPDRNPLFSIIARRLVERGHMPPPEPPPAPGVFALASPQRIGELLAAAGFDEVRTEEITVRVPVPGVAEYIEFTADTAGPLALVVRGLGDAEREALGEELQEPFERFAVGDRYELPGLALGTVAT